MKPQEKIIRIFYIIVASVDPTHYEAEVVGFGSDVQFEH